MTRKVLETLREAMEFEAYCDSMPAEAPSAPHSDRERARVLAWLDAFEKHAPAIKDALRATCTHVHHYRDEEYGRALDWLEATTKDEGE